MAEPVVKWVGGKRALAGELVARLPAEFRCYHEPFIGGGALFFAIRPRFSYLADANGELINLYRVIKHRPVPLMAALGGFAFGEADYYRVRDLDRSQDFAALGDVERAARFLYLNRTGFNGLWRVNRRGQVNTAYGWRANPTLFSSANVLAVHEALRTARLATAPYWRVMDVVRRGDLVYFDPPYDCDRRGFVGYVADGFCRDDQIDLWRLCVKLHRLGVKWMLSNADTPFIRRLYQAFRIEFVAAPRLVGRDAAARRPAAEVIVRNY